MTIREREDRVRRILRKQRRRLIKSARRQCLYTIMKGSAKDGGTDFVDVLERFTVIGNLEVYNKIEFVVGRVKDQLIEAALIELDERSDFSRRAAQG